MCVCVCATAHARCHASEIVRFPTCAPLSFTASAVAPRKVYPATPPTVVYPCGSAWFADSLGVGEEAPSEAPGLSEGSKGEEEEEVAWEGFLAPSVVSHSFRVLWCTCCAFVLKLLLRDAPEVVV